MFGNTLLDIVVSSIIIYVFIIIGLRLLGKNQLAQLSVSDLVFILLISNSVQNAMVGGDNSLIGGIVAAGTLFLLNKTFDFVHYKSDKFARIMDGEPVVLIRHGKINRKEMKRNFMSLHDLEEALREKGIGDIHSVDLAILEVDGKISILSDKNIEKGSRFDIDEEHIS